MNLASAKSLRRLETCNETPTQHEGGALLTLYGDPESLDNNDIALIEESCKEAMEQVEPDPCFKVLELTIDISSMPHRSLLSKEETNHESTRRKLSNENNFQINIWYTFQCFGCNGNLFQNDASRRSLGAMLENSQHGFKGSKSKRSGQATRDLPPQSTFRNKFNAIISSIPNLRGKGYRMKTMFELVKRQCDASVQSLVEIDLSITFEGNFAYLQDVNDGSDTQVNVIEESIRNAFNYMNMPNQHSCDSHFRKMQEVRYSYSHPAYHLDDDDSFVMVFHILYASQNGFASDIFDHLGNKRDFDRNGMDMNVVSKPSRLAECFCDATAKFDRAPTMNEFLSTLANILSIRSDEHFITSVVIES